MNASLTAFVELIVVTIPSDLPFLAVLILYDNFDTQQTEDEDSLTVSQGWYILVDLLPHCSCNKRRK
jgi:hypothetical protein